MAFSVRAFWTRAIGENVSLKSGGGIGFGIRLSTFGRRRAGLAERCTHRPAAHCGSLPFGCLMAESSRCLKGAATQIGRCYVREPH